jgi:hypothetical protein
LARCTRWRPFVEDPTPRPVLRYIAEGVQQRHLPVPAVAAAVHGRFKPEKASAAGGSSQGNIKEDPVKFGHVCYSMSAQRTASVVVALP